MIIKYPTEYKGGVEYHVNYHDSDKYNYVVNKIVEPFYIQDVSGASNTITFKKNGVYAPTVTLEYSTDGTTWTRFGSTSTSGLTYTLPANGKVCFRGENNSFGSNTSYYNNITFSGDANVGGDLTTLLNKTGDLLDLTGRDDVFYSLFEGNTHLIDASDLILPSTTLAVSCYDSMFRLCTSLLECPELNASTIALKCYSNMFSGCKKLLNAPSILPATQLAKQCYENMFYGNSSLITAPVLPATLLADLCYHQMFLNCTSLTIAPELPGNQLVDKCYFQMFFGCSKLSFIKIGALDWNSSYSSNWLYDVAATGDFYKKSSVSIPNGASGIPYGWTVHNE